MRRHPQIAQFPELHPLERHVALLLVNDTSRGAIARQLGVARGTVSTIFLTSRRAGKAGHGAAKARPSAVARRASLCARGVPKHYTDEEKELNQAWEKIEKLDVPLDKITFETKDTEDGNFTIARMDGAMVFVHGDKSKFNNELSIFY